MKRYIVFGAIVAAGALLSGCKKESTSADEGSESDLKPRDRGSFKDAGATPTTQPSTMTAMGGTMAGNMPNDATHAPFQADADLAPKFNPLPEWQPQAARSMTDQVFALAKAEGDPEDADLALSHLQQHIPMQGNIARWASMFGYMGADVTANAKTTELEGVTFPTTLVDISGTYKGSMMSPMNPPKENYRLLVAEIRTPQMPYYVRLLGPAKTVAKWEEAYMKFLRDAAGEKK